MKLMRTILVICAAIVAATPAGALANAGQGYRALPSLVVAQQNGPSLSEAVEQVRRQYRGRIVSATTKVRGNREVHIIKVLTEDGKVKTVRVPGRTRGNKG